MTKNITTVINNLPKYLLNTVVKTQYFFYGNNKNLKNLKAKLIEYNSNALIQQDDKSLLLFLDITINEENILKIDEDFQSLALSCQVDYDAFQIAIDDRELNRTEYSAFEKHFKPKSYVKIQLSDGQYTYLLFLGGSKLTGYFFDCVSLTDDGNASIEQLDKASRIFRQPIQGVFDPQLCSYVDHSKLNNLPLKISFRLLEGGDSPEQIDELYKRYNICESDHKSWLLALEKILQNDDTTLACKSTMKLEATINKNGKAQWSDMLPLTADEYFPMPFGCFLDYDKLNAIFIENINELELIDKVYFYA